MGDLTSLTSFANPPQNIVGSVLFLSYIILALYGTMAITISLWRQYNFINIQDSMKEEDRSRIKTIYDARKRHISIYAFLASISFATLSYHMSRFLIHSYASWAGKVDVKFGDVTVESLKTWMWNTSLFAGFAKELVIDAPSAACTQRAILATYLWNIWMAQKIQRRGLTLKTTFPYIMLSQILPISFIVMLFIIQLHLSAPDVTAGFSEADPQASTDPQTNPTAPPNAIQKRTSLTLPTIILNASLFALPPLRESAFFIPLVLLTRLMLLTPYSGRVNLRDAQVVQSIAISGGFLVAHMFMIRRVASFGEVFGGCWTGGEAVQALGWDAQLGAILFFILGWGGGV